MEDSKYLSKEDKDLMESLQKELKVLKAEHKDFAKNVGKLTPEQREKWRLNSQRTNEIYIAIKDLRFKNVIEAGSKI